MPWDRRRVDPRGSYVVARPFRYGGRDLRVGEAFPVREDRLRADQLLRRGLLAPATATTAPPEAAAEEVLDLLAAAAEAPPDPEVAPAPRRRRRSRSHGA